MSGRFRRLIFQRWVGGDEPSEELTSADLLGLAIAINPLQSFYRQSDSCGYCRQFTVAMAEVFHEGTSGIFLLEKKFYADSKRVGEINIYLSRIRV
jgi:hypothetical protein